MSYFWKQQDDLPQGLGYPLFGPTHILSVLITLTIVFLAVHRFRKMNAGTQEKWLKAIPLIMMGMEIFKDFFLVSVNRFGLGYLPLHICSIGIFVFLLNEWVPWIKVRDVLGEIAFVIIMPSSFAALLFADWTVYYPVWNFMNLYSYLWHGMLILYPILKKVKGDITPSIKHIHYVIIFLCLVVPPVYLFDKRFDCNYFFVNRPVPGTPLAWLASRMGNPGYLLGYGGLVVIVILGVYAGLFLYESVTLCG